MVVKNGDVSHGKKKKHIQQTKVYGFWVHGLTQV